VIGAIAVAEATVAAIKRAARTTVAATIGETTMAAGAARTVRRPLRVAAIRPDP
jgi:hypothetical protein